MGVAIGLSCLMGISGCDIESGRERTSPSAPATSAIAQEFKSDVDALAAARRTYQAYLGASQQVSEKGGIGIEQLAPYVSRAEYTAEVASAQYLRENHLRAIGATKLLRFSLQSVDRRLGIVHAYACVDLTDVHVLTELGKDVTPTKRPTRQTSVPEFRFENGRFVLFKDESWSGQSLC